MEEKERIRPLAEGNATSSLAGYCDECGVWSDDLRTRDDEGLLLCSDCISDGSPDPPQQPFSVDISSSHSHITTASGASGEA
jgi:hypothetical protein